MAHKVAHKMLLFIHMGRKYIPLASFFAQNDDDNNDNKYYTQSNVLWANGALPYRADFFQCEKNIISR